LPKNYVSHHFNGSWFGGDAENKHKKMVNIYGLLERLVTHDGAQRAVHSILNDHKIIMAEQILDLIPEETIKNYIQNKSSEK